MLRTPLSLMALLLGQTIIAAPLLAQSTDADEVVLDQVALRGQQGAGTATGPVQDANPVTLTGAKSATPVTEVPQSVTVIGADRLKALNIAKLDAALSFSAGVSGQPYGHDSDTNWVFIRGFNATQHGAYQDGLPNYAYGFGGFYMDPFLVERVEVLKGASSVLYGGSNPGGLINSVTKAPTGRPGTELEFGADNNGRIWTSMDQNGRLSASADYRFVAKLQRNAGHGAFEAGGLGLVSGSIRQRFESGAELTFGLDLLKVKEDHAGGAWLPYEGTAVDAPFGRLPHGFNVGEPGHDRYERDQVSLRAVWTQDLGGWDFTNTTRLARARVEEDSVLAYGYAGGASDAVGTLSRGVFDHKTSALTFLNDTRITRTLHTGGIEHQLLFGLDLKHFRMDVLEASGFPAPGLTVVNPAYGAVLPVAVPYKDVRITQRQAGLYFQDQMRWGDGWIGTANLRYDRVSTRAATGAGANISERTDGAWSGRLGLAKTFSGGLTVYASASTFFNPALEPTAAGNTLHPETGRQIEAGLKWAPNKDFLLTATVFDLRRNNVTQSQWAGGGYVFSQIGSQRSRGFELEAQGRISEGLSIAAAVTLMDVKVLRDQNAALVGKTPWAVPENSAALQLAWTPKTAPDWTFTGAARYTGASWADEANTLAVRGRTVFDLGVAYRFDNGWNANFAVTNLADKTYVSSCAGLNYCYYGEGRTVSLSLSKAF